MFPENPLVLILLGAGISLVTSVVVTAVQARLVRRDSIRTSSRASARTLTSAFIAERDSVDGGDSFLAEAELTVMSMTDRKTRDRLRDVIRLLRERALPEIEELSGVRSERSRQLLCDHALEVLGAHLRSEKLPEVPAAVRKMLSVEEEALSIHSGETPRPAEPIAKSAVTPRPRHTGAKTPAPARKPAKSAAKTPAKPAAKGGRSSSAAAEEPAKESAFWDD
ncbi:hypothetical protein [Nocardiopsis sp. HUAS JQ3]|uniref:hypothetical protein n=1 Tax=Nocardiopsis sp. HUAS JQ3 TaxID=3061629 RepID=UPI0023A9B64B|nr:hypothetical protein [Nocardiopsis sp. HUAS JQ3]WDZ90881.1 hypothetical protein PV789_29070 [Nocardiopsis sp. HUAS JQ3]